ncbi:hypothetical protein SAMN05216241_11626 [Limimonas halophila]|uniref:Sigma-70, region 4 n=1 Tax=Limimonas halophila TaxID=1082479 RepID=A0A1G7UUB7_9PROT|nr:hypothetical protein [Limimonas halophila]SDG50330.1 hypothetical protein SAMN05216241_11626 [Limimonas halophila]
MTRCIDWSSYITPARPAAVLTRSHRDVVALAVNSFTGPEIADALALPEHEVRWLLREAAAAAAMKPA